MENNTVSDRKPLTAFNCSCNEGSASVRNISWAIKDHGKWTLLGNDLGKGIVQG